MRNITLLFLLLSVVVISSRFVTDVPLAIWCGEGYLNGQNIPVSTTLLPNDVEYLLHAFVVASDTSEGYLSQYLNLNMKPEVVVIFAERKIRSDQMSTYKNSFTNLRNLIKTEKSSLVAPFVDLSISFDNSIVNVAKSTPGSVFYVGKVSTLLHDIKRKVPTIVHIKGNLEETISDNIFSNGVTDLIIVYLDSMVSTLDNKFMASDATIESVQRYISSKTSKYVGVYTGLEYDAPQLKTKFATDLLHSKRHILQNPENATNNNMTLNIFQQYFGGWFWELFIICVILIPLLVIGVFAIDGIQTPLFDSKIKKK